MKNLKLFETHDDFNAAKNNLALPNISLIREDHEVIFIKEEIEQYAKFTAKYKITQEVIDLYTRQGIAEIPLLTISQGYLKSYNINGELYEFEEPNYEELGEKQIDYTLVQGVGMSVINIDNCIQAGNGSFNTNMTWSVEGEVDFENDCIIEMCYVDGICVYNNWISIDDAQNFCNFNENYTSFSLSDDYCEMLNSAEFIQEEFGENAEVYFGYAYMRIQDEEYINDGYISNTITIFNNGNEQKEISFINETYFPTTDSMIELEKIELVTTAITWTIDREITDNDYIVYTSKYVDDEFNYIIAYPVKEVIEYGYIIFHDDKKTISLSPEACNNYNNDSSLISFGISIVEKECVITENTISKPTTVTKCKLATLTNLNELSPNFIYIPCTQDELDKEYIVEYTLNKCADNIGKFGHIYIFGTNLGMHVFEVDLSNLSYQKINFINSTFFECINLTSIVIPNSVTNIGDSAFSNCSSLSEIVIPDSVTNIGDSAFSNCSGLTSITIPDSVTSIGDHAFHRCYNLTSVIIGNSVTSIDGNIFTFCSSLQKITVSSGNTAYDSRDNCNAIINSSTNKLICGCQNTVIPNSVTSIGEYAFDGCSSLTSIIIPDSVTSIDEYAFYYCSSLTSITIPDSVTSIGEYAFGDCKSLTLVIIGNSVTSIGNDAFINCSSLTSITIPDSVTSIGDYVFNCDNLISITCNSITSPTVKTNTFYGVHSNGILYYPKGSDYSSWMSTDSYYLGYYNWTSQEIE